MVFRRDFMLAGKKTFLRQFLIIGRYECGIHVHHNPQHIRNAGNDIIFNGLGDRVTFPDAYFTVNDDMQINLDA
jgi:hypothetical protein